RCARSKRSITKTTCPRNGRTTTRRTWSSSTRSDPPAAPPGWARSLATTLSSPPCRSRRVPMGEITAEDASPHDVLIVGGGPAGLSAALNLGRALAQVVLIDADRPRNAATVNSHGFLTRDGVPPHELRKIARAELVQYENVGIR